MQEITASHYWAEVSALASSIASDALQASGSRDEAEDLINDYILETTDGHQWVIYNSYNLEVYRHSDNPNYYLDNFGHEDAGLVIANRGLEGLHQVIAFWCMYADVQDKISAALDDLGAEEMIES